MKNVISNYSAAAVISNQIKNDSLKSVGDGLGPSCFNNVQP